MARSNMTDRVYRFDIAVSTVFVTTGVTVRAWIAHNWCPDSGRGG